jgi:putative phosphoesterase
MRLAIVADIHGNFRALQAVHADLKTHSPDMILNLGDHLSGPLQAAETADYLMNENWVTLRGNHDRQLLDRPVSQMGPSDRAAHAQLNQSHMNWLASLPATQSLDAGILLIHGTPRNDLEYLLEEVSEREVRLATTDRIREKLGNTKAKLILCGHSHIPRVIALEDHTQIVNPGSVGLQAYDGTEPFPHYMETRSPYARYAIVDFTGDRWEIKPIEVEYNWNAAAREASAANRPDWAHALATGCALR